MNPTLKTILVASTSWVVGGLLMSAYLGKTHEQLFYIFGLGLILIPLGILVLRRFTQSGKHYFPLLN